ncbi:glycoside hydrolase family 1 protein [Subtercola boreus]|uniref:Beta-glucosidase n=1 Tax=Subtercola boreus TaxID=120213 RepID=A0A3E0WB69_9MICO|nr:family 1 glycosylhydrolase [Subtercola boreus]RFA20042.1 beta-glucosidase [Subtercola boreus]RFA20171.1 beta-glucosidase [Subtercola boreus]RFA26498.1 beta-glucosidase [Subtercola boreus]
MSAARNPVGSSGPRRSSPRRSPAPGRRRTDARDTAQGEAEAFATRLPAGFVLGVSTSAFQVEGGSHDGGRTLSVWDDFSHQPGRIRGGATADVAADHFHRVSEDVALLATLGAESYSFSFGWPRLQPGGAGSLNRDGIAFYDRLLDELLAAGISPMATLFHWDTPVELRGGWLNRDTANRFGDYAYEVGEQFGDRIDRWVTLHEPATVMLNGYALGMHAPGGTALFDALPAGHHQLVGHGLAVQALRAASVTGEVGIANAYSPVSPVTASDDDVAFAALYDIVHNTMFGDAVLRGSYPPVPDEFQRLLRPLVEAPEGDLVIIRQPLDFYGIDYLAPTRIASGAGGQVSPDGEASALTSLPFHVAPWPEFDRTGSGRPNAPEFLGVALTELAARYGEALPPVFVTEGGVGLADRVELDAETGAPRVRDGARIDYLTSHVAAALDAVAPGGPAAAVHLRGYYIRSLLDGFEWAAGYGERFGLVHVDFTTRDRTPKQSFEWVQRVLEARS